VLKAVLNPNVIISALLVPGGSCLVTATCWA